MKSLEQTAGEGERKHSRRQRQSLTFRYEHTASGGRMDVLTEGEVEEDLQRGEILGLR